jgi:hypothetical protein
MEWVCCQPPVVIGWHGRLRGSRWSELILRLIDCLDHAMESALASVPVGGCRKLRLRFTDSLRLLPLHSVRHFRGRHQFPRSLDRYHFPQQSELSLVDIPRLFRRHDA